ncbi:MAG: hypothetical protein EOM91_10445 [Sphingobacteriia bacterium]|nr:hypothetical protein [Sphingobacteriia bacterium]NCC41044.1 hypothetical protein [Gammaproteobacteria bacterium]
MTWPLVQDRPVGSRLPREVVECHLAHDDPERFSAASLTSFAQNTLGTWTAAGFLNGRVRKIRSAPAPPAPKPTLLDDLEKLSGNAQLLELYNRYDELVGLSQDWTRTAQALAKRLPTWTKLNELLRHAANLGPGAALQAEAAAIVSQRGVLADPDPVLPLLDQTVTLLRQALGAKLDDYRAAFQEQQTLLHSDADWLRLSEAQRDELIALHHLTPLDELPLGTPEQLQDALDACDLDHWVSRIQALPSRFEAARHAAVQRLKPNVVRVTLPRRTLNDEAELKHWLAEVEALLSEQLKQGPVAL